MDTRRIFRKKEDMRRICKRGMVIAAVDPDRKDLKLLRRALRKVYPGCEVAMFTDPEKAASYVRDHPIDALFTEVLMPGRTGFGLSAALKAVQPSAPTVFVTETDAYAAEAIRARAEGYILKPVTGQEIQNSLYETKFRIG